MIPCYSKQDLCYFRYFPLIPGSGNNHKAVEILWHSHFGSIGEIFTSLWHAWKKEQAFGTSSYYTWLYSFAAPSSSRYLIMILYALIERKMHHSIIILESYIKKLQNGMCPYCRPQRFSTSCLSFCDGKIGFITVDFLLS